MTPDDALALASWRRRTGELYARVRAAGSDDPDAFAAFWAERDALVRTHPASPLPPERRAAFTGYDHHAYDPALRLLLELEPMAAGRDGVDADEPLEVRLASDGVVLLWRAGRVRFAVGGEPCALSVFWLGGYGGGLFLPFGDATNGRDSYGGGRYVLDGVKGADLGTIGGRLVVDFNYAYAPSCSLDPRWDCPLAPIENRLPVPIRAGERWSASRGTISDAAMA